MTRPTPLPRFDHYTPTRTVLVVGASYAGHRAIQQLVTFLPSSWKVKVLERNTHFNREWQRDSMLFFNAQVNFLTFSKTCTPFLACQS
jgi:hypothetical protein